MSARFPPRWPGRYPGPGFEIALCGLLLVVSTGLLNPLWERPSAARPPAAAASPAKTLAVLAWEGLGPPFVVRPPHREGPSS